MNVNIKKIILPNLPYVLFLWLFDKVGQAFRLAAGADLSAKILNLGGGFNAAFENIAPSLHLLDLCVGIAGMAVIRLIVYFKGKNARLGCCPLFSMDAIYRGAIPIWSAN